jgi:hypothetical protein
LKEYATDLDTDNRSWAIARYSEAREQLRVNADVGQTIYPQRFTYAGDKKEQGDARVIDYIPQTVYAIVASSIREQKRSVIFNVNKARWIAARRNIQTRAT